MKIFRVSGFGLLLLGLAILFYSIVTGNAKVGVFLIFPFFIGTGLFSAIGILLIFLALILLFFSVTELKTENLYAKPSVKTEKKAGGFILIGPIPIVFGSDKKMLYISLLLLAITVILLIFFLELYSFFG